MLDDTKKKIVVSATVDLPRGRGVLVTNGFILTASHLIDYDLIDKLFLGEPYIEEIKTVMGSFRVALLAVEPASDIAVLGCLDNQTFYEEAEQYENFCENTPAINLCMKYINRKPYNELEFNAYVYTHEGKWITVKAGFYGRPTGRLWADFSEPIKGGTSGSPIVTQDGELLGVVSSSGESGGIPTGGLQAHACCALPQWLVRTITDDQNPSQ